MIERVIVRRGAFLDSVTLMLVSQAAESVDGIESASVVNATPLNLALIERQGFDVGGEDPPPGPNDLVIAVRGSGEESLADALSLIEERLRSRSAPGRAGAEAPPARSVSAAARRNPDLSLAAISVPGSHAAYECSRALDAGLDVFCFSSGPSLEQESALKARAAELGLLLMGPDCGTAILGGVSLGFGNALRRGPVGIVGASGTGIQAVSCRLDAAGIGISQAIGTGGRDLNARIGGAMTLRGIEILAEDPDTRTVAVIAKSPDPELAGRVAEAVEASGKQAVLAFPGLGQAGSDHGFAFTSSLEEAAEAVARSLGTRLPAADRRGSLEVNRGTIRGLFSGGTLRDEAWSIIAEVAEHVGLEPEEAAEGRHVLVDLGDERFTEGRPHPMIDPSLRVSMIEGDRLEGVGTLLLDVVLGWGAHPDPAAELGPAIEHALERKRGELSVIIFLCGTDEDPQKLDRQADRLVEAGAVVTRSNADAARLALESAGVVGAPS